jgi:putative NIF3 family GTP cyclohydrolase 1 type 2
MNLSSQPTAGELIDRIMAQIPPATTAATADTLKSGSREDPVRGIVVTFTATWSVLQRATDLGANLIITHEPTFYSAEDDTAWLAGDPVYLVKRDCIARHRLVIWRFHDGCHRMRPDGIVIGMAGQLGWTVAGSPAKVATVFAVPPQSARALAASCRQRLGIGPVRLAGDPDVICRRVGLLVGAPGGRHQIRHFQTHRVDAVISGESPEWETCEYVRDATASGHPCALIVLGHANSEEAGIAWIARWVRALLPEAIPVHHVPAGDPFIVI